MDDEVQVIPYRPEQKTQALELYLTHNELPDISYQVDVPVDLLIQWIDLEQWAAIRQRMDGEKEARAEEKYKQFIIEKMLPVQQTQLELAERVQKLIKNRLTHDDGTPVDYVPTRELRSIAQTLADSVKITDAALGRNDKGVEDTKNRQRIPRSISPKRIGEEQEAVVPAKRKPRF